MTLDVLREKTSHDVFIIAEVGKNFIQTEDERPIAEYLENAKKLAKAAKGAGADAVKFQTHEVEDEVLNIEFTSPHFKAKDRYAWVTRNTTSTPLEEFWKPLKAYCDDIGVMFFSTPMSRKAAMKLTEVDTPLWKVGSGDAQDYVLLDYLIATKKPIIISSGMVSLAELDDVVTYIQGKGELLAVLYCISQYPAPAEYFNLATIRELREKYPGLSIGFSDHSRGDEVARAAVAAGATIIEKHFSFSRDLWGADHKVSMTPEEFASIKNDKDRIGRYLLAVSRALTMEMMNQSPDKETVKKLMELRELLNNGEKVLDLNKEIQEKGKQPG